MAQVIGVRYRGSGSQVSPARTHDARRVFSPGTQHNRGEEEIPHQVALRRACTFGMERDRRGEQGTWGQVSVAARTMQSQPSGADDKSRLIQEYLLVFIQGLPDVEYWHLSLICFVSYCPFSTHMASTDVQPPITPISPSSLSLTFPTPKYKCHTTYCSSVGRKSGQQYTWQLLAVAVMNGIWADASQAYPMPQQLHCVQLT